MLCEHNTGHMREHKRAVMSRERTYCRTVIPVPRLHSTTSLRPHIWPDGDPRFVAAQLPENVDTEHVEAKLENGELFVKVPKLQQPEKAGRIVTVQ